jgi:ADP-dependent NAD(P)H-hydrate dehydratase / NAD(P)H-hydrate epimerase
MLILTSRQMSYVDRITVERTGISYQMLMETAGVRVVEAVGEYIAEQRSAGVKGNWRIVVVCGQGNNGGDGVVAARHLWLRQLGRIEVFLIGKSLGSMRRL